MPDPTTLLSRGLRSLPAFILVLLSIAPPIQADSGSTEANKTVAQVGDLNITLDSVLEHAAADLGPLDQQRDKILRSHLDEVVAEQLIAIEAAALGITPESYLVQELSKQLEPVTDAEVEGFYTANRARIPQALDSVSEEIRLHLTSQRRQQKRISLVADLSAKYPVVLDWEPYRIDVASSIAPFRGPSNAPVDLVIFSDFQCPWCSRIAPDLEKVANQFKEDLRVTYRHFPLSSIHPHAQAAAESSVCAAEQGEFWTWHDALFDKQSEIGSLDYNQLAETLKLDTQAFASCLESADPGQQVRADAAAAKKLGISSTPSLFVNGRQLQLTKARPIAEQIADLIQEELGR